MSGRGDDVVVLWARMFWEGRPDVDFWAELERHERRRAYCRAMLVLVLCVALPVAFAFWMVLSR
jgi:hypothetical protein